MTIKLTPLGLENLYFELVGISLGSKIRAQEELEIAESLCSRYRNNGKPILIDVTPMDGCMKSYEHLINFKHYASRGNRREMQAKRFLSEFPSLQEKHGSIEDLAFQELEGFSSSQESLSQSDIMAIKDVVRQYSKNSVLDAIEYTFENVAPILNKVVGAYNCYKRTSSEIIHNLRSEDIDNLVTRPMDETSEKNINEAENSFKQVIEEHKKFQTYKQKPKKTIQAVFTEEVISHSQIPASISHNLDERIIAISGDADSEYHKRAVDRKKRFSKFRKNVSDIMEELKMWYLEMGLEGVFSELFRETSVSKIN